MAKKTPSFHRFKRTPLILRQAMKHPRHYAIPDNFVDIIHEVYDGSTVWVVENGRLFTVETGLKNRNVQE